MSNFIFQDEPEENEKAPLRSDKKWRILIVDDDDSVHQITKLVLNDALIEGRELELVSVFSQQEAKELLLEQNDFSMAFVDVVMETDHAGLELVKWIRNDLQNQAIRIILRTGQAGTAPEAQVIKDFDINDYKEKTDFTAGKMMTTVYAGIRAYRDIMTIQRSLDAFKQLISVTHDLLRVNHVRAFGSAALNHLLTLMDVDSSALYIARNKVDFEQESTNVIVACTGKYTSESDCLENADIDGQVKQRIVEAFTRKKHFTDEHCFIGYYETAANSSCVLYIEFENDKENFRANLAEIYGTNVVLILEGLSRQHEVERAQKELMCIVGDAIETRSGVAGPHVMRAAVLCEIFAQKLQLSDTHTEAIKLAAPLHDIGKVVIPDHILNKPDTLDDEEWLVMRTHAEAGANLLSKSSASIAKLGAKMAHFHHENWDGSGYPKKLTGDDIPIEARIMAIVDVFDALGSDRCYRSAWSEEDIKGYITEQRGIKFDPQLVDIFIEHYQEMLEVRNNYPD